MAYGGDPANDSTDAVRLLIFDTDNTDLLFADAEIDYFIATESTVYSAAARAAQSLANKFNRQANKQVGDLRIWYREQAAQYLAIANDLDNRSKLGAGAPYAGGISVSDKKTRSEDTTATQPSFTRNQFSNSRKAQSPNPAVKTYEEDS